MNRSKRVVFTFALVSLTLVFGFASFVNAEYGPADTDGFQRPVEKKPTVTEEESKLAPSSKNKKNKADAINESDENLDGFQRPKEQKKTISKETEEERQKTQEASDALFYENLDGFKRPKKSN